MNPQFLAVLTLSAAVVPFASAGPIAYAICQTGCNGLAVACYAAANCIFGTVAAAVAPPAIQACNTALGACMAACAVVTLGGS